MPKDRIELIMELEEYFNKPVFLITYNYSTNPFIGFIEPGDEFHFRQFRNKVLGGISQCVFILNGPGGNMNAAIACSQILRDTLLRYDCFVPTVVGSALCYFVLQSNRLLVGEKSLITQIDPLFNYNGEDMRAVEHLTNKDSEIRKSARGIHSLNLENLRRILKDEKHVFKKGVSQESQKKLTYLGRMVDLWMKKNNHDEPLIMNDFEKLKINFKKIPEEIIDIARDLINKCQEELIKENKRFVIQTSKIEEEKYLGGYFYS